MKKFDSIIERAVNDEIIAGLRRREQEIRDNLEFARWYAEQDFDEDVGEFDAPDDEPDADVFDFEEEAELDVTEYDAAFDDVWLYEETGDVDDDEL
jgi:hypothetical protein